jgi:integrase
MEARKRAKPSTPERYLWRKPGARHLWFRMAVPVRYKSIEQRRIIQLSLGTTDRRDASVKAARLRAELYDKWQASASVDGAPTISQATRVTPTIDQLREAATEACYVNVQPRIEALWREKRASSATAHDDYINDLKRHRAKYIATRETETLVKWQTIADKRIERNGWMLRKDDREYDQFVQMISEAAIDLLRVEIERRSGNFASAPTSAVVTSALERRQSRAKAGEGISELFERYASQRRIEGRKRSDTIAQDRKIILQFAEFVGSNRSVASLTQTDVREWRETIAALPPKHNSMKDYAGLSLRDAAVKARAEGASLRSPTTVNKYLSTVSPFLAWSVRNGFAERNPCDGLFYDLPKGRNPRPPFSVEQLIRIFSSPLFAGFEADGLEHRQGSRRTDDWRYWIPLLCLFTGARISEIAQLRIDDLQYEKTIPFLHLRHDERLGQRTKSGKSRLVPIHPKLAEIGFIALVGETGFEPATLCSQSRCATRLRHSPTARLLDEGQRRDNRAIGY